MNSLSDLPNLSTVMTFERTNGTWENLAPRDTQDLCQRQIPPLQHFYEFSPLISAITVEKSTSQTRNDYIDLIFKDAVNLQNIVKEVLKTESIPQDSELKIVDPKSPMYQALEEALPKHYAAMEPHMVLTGDHINRILQNFQLSDADPKSKGVLFLCLGLMMTSMTSSRFMGDELNSPEPLRGYAAALLYQAQECGVLTPDQFSNAASMLHGKTFSCTGVLTNRYLAPILRDYIKTHPDQASHFEHIKAMVIPGLWKL